MIQSMTNLEPKTSMVQCGIINGPDYDQTEIIKFSSTGRLKWNATYTKSFKY